MKYVANVYQVTCWPYGKWTDINNWENEVESISVIHLLDESYDTAMAARKAEWAVVRQLWEKIDACREWAVIKSPLFDKCIVTTKATGNMFNMNYYVAEIHEEDEN